MTNPPVPGPTPVLLHGTAARRALRHATGLLLLASTDPLLGGLIRLGNLYEVPWPPDTDRYITLIRIGAVHELLISPGCCRVVVFAISRWYAVRARRRTDRGTAAVPGTGPV
ncbi:hypothetical protein [Streptomyces sp. MNP-20]|uniref:hypothetical protein n=1 Tax=Streptomyces sp. MNP-20 TaxID=2721165 RepID=UPI0015552050|nr:hypothetical protein [Streptomyces sp. MNP-20]